MVLPSGAGGMPALRGSMLGGEAHQWAHLKWRLSMEIVATTSL